MSDETVALREWDSDFFSRRVGELDAHNLEKSSALILDQYDLVVSKISAQSPDLVRQAESCGFRFAEAEVDFTLTGLPSPSQGIALAPATAEDIPAIKDIARRTLKHSRFSEPWFSHEDRARLYARWAEKAVSGTFDDVCLVERGKDQVTGFVTIRKLQSGDARIGLIAVNAESARRGIGARLLSQAYAWCEGQGIATLHVATQGSNHAALKFYARNAFAMSSLHYWLYRTPSATSEPNETS